jgi:antirestriction protein
MEGESTTGAGAESADSEQIEQRQQEQHEVLHEETPRVYVASLSDYNNGVLHGEWIDAAQEPEQLHDAVTAMLARSPSDPRAEEFAVHDYEYFGACRIGEYDSIDWISAVARGIDEHGLAFAAWAEECGGDEERLARFDDAYLGSYDSLTDYAEQLLDDLGLARIVEEHVPESLQAYVAIDAEAFGNDLTQGGDVTIVSNADGVWVFEGMI